MKQNPEYLQNQSRRLHALHRRERLRLNVLISLWVIGFFGLSIAAGIDRFGSMGWGLSDYLWPFIGFLAFGPCFWVFSTLILKLNLAFVKHTYGQEPVD